MRAILFALLLIAVASASAAESVQVVDGLHAALMENMRQGQTRSCAQRAEYLRPVVARAFDLPLIAHQVLRRAWEGLNEAQRAAFTRQLQELVVVSYARAFAQDEGARFTPASTDTAAGPLRVHARLELPTREPVEFDYLMRERDGMLRIVNVIADGVSDVAARSAQYHRVIQEQGFERLLERLQEQNKGC